MRPQYAAIEQALLLQKRPEQLSAMRQDLIPDGMAALIRLASDEGESRRDLALDFGVSEKQLQSAAVEFLMAVCLYPDSSALRTLGLNPGANFRIAKDHHRLLLKWLHPDRNPGSKLLAERVNQAWMKLKPLLEESQEFAVQPHRVLVSHHTGVPSSGRFPFFLWSLIGLSLVFLAWSLIPDSEIYVGESGGSELSRDKPVHEDEQLGNDDQFVQRLRNLETTFKQALAPVKTKQLPASKQIKHKADELKPVIQESLERQSIESRKVAVPAAKTLAVQPALPNMPVQIVQTAVVSAPLPAESNVLPAGNATASASQPAAPVNALPLTISRRDKARALINAFSQSYQQGDINRFMQLFSDDARNNRGGLDAVSQDYSRLFAASSQRKIQFNNMQWQDQPPALRMRARYVASVKNKGQMASKTNKGGIEMVFIEINGQLLIQRILLSE